MALGGHGVEAIRVVGAHAGNYYGDIIATYVNMGDTYDLTLVHDSENNSFHLTSYGDWVQAYEEEHPPEDSCSDCGQMFRVDELDADTGKCPACRDRDEAEAQLSRDLRTPDGRSFDVWVLQRRRDPNNPELAKAYWTIDLMGDPELVVELKYTYLGSGQAIGVVKFLREGGNILFERVRLGERHERIDSGWRLAKDSIGRALVALDEFLEQLEAIKQALINKEIDAGEMDLQEIKAAVDAGLEVHWMNDGYRVIKDRIGQYLIEFTPNGSIIGLTWTDGVTMNGKPSEFYIGSKR